MTQMMPLDDLRVVEIAEQVAGPYAAKMLADFGADVLKVETLPFGDPARQRGPFAGDQPDSNASGMFLYLNMNKRGLIIDPANTVDRDALEREIAQADVLVTNLTALRLATLALSLADLRVRFPRLVMAAITPFGLSGPYAGFVADDLIVYAMSGLASGTPGLPDSVENADQFPPLHPAAAITDTLAGAVAASAVLMAIVQRSISGQGALIDVSQQAVMASLDQRGIGALSYAGLIAGRTLDNAIRMPNCYLPCRDGYVAIAAPLDHQWQRLVDAMGQPDWADSPLFQTAIDRMQYWDALKLLLLEWTMARSGDEIWAIARETGLPLFPFVSLAQMMQSPQVAARGSLVTIEAGDGAFQVPGAPLQSADSGWSLRMPAPRWPV